MVHRKIDNRRKKSWGSRVKRFFSGKQSRARSNMRIDLYATCWNEERMLPFFLRHYDPIVDRMVIFDDGSSDRSCDLLASSPKVELRRLKQGESSILMQKEELNSCWKESRGRADWVIICDIDEQVYHHRQLRDYLEQCKASGVTILNPVGMEMISSTFPPADAVLSETIRRGVRSFPLDKAAVFDPNSIEEINYWAGRHVSFPTGRIVFSEKCEVKILHYKYLGLDYVISRSEDLRSRKTAFDRERGWGAHDYRSRAEFELHFEELLSQAEDVSLIGNKPPAAPATINQRRL